MPFGLAWRGWRGPIRPIGCAPDLVFPEAIANGVWTRAAGLAGTDTSLSLRGMPRFFEGNCGNMRGWCSVINIEKSIQQELDAAPARG